jgi:hypothetical protein
MSMMPRSAKRFSDNIILKIKGRMMPESVKRFSDNIMRTIRGHV